MRVVARKRRTDGCGVLKNVFVVVAVMMKSLVIYGSGSVIPPAAPLQGRVDLHVMSMLRNETVSVHVPSKMSGAMLPLVVLLHGVGGSGPELATYFGLADVSEALEFAWVAPNGVRSRGCKPWSGNDRRWCGASCCGCCECDEGSIWNNDARDSNFLRAMLETILEDTSLRIDPRRIHVLGRSNGGFMAYRLACEHADLIASILTICAGFYKGEDVSLRCSPSEPVGVVHVHGTNDKLIPYGCNAVPAVQNWAALQGCDAMPVDVEPVATSYGAFMHRRWGRRLGTARALRYENCDDGVNVELVTAMGVGHCPDETWINIERWLIDRPKRASMATQRRATTAFSTASISDTNVSRRRCLVCNGMLGGTNSGALPTSIVGIIAGSGIALLVGFAAALHLVERRRRTRTAIAVAGIASDEEGFHTTSNSSVRVLDDC